MDIAKTKRDENIAEYVLYIWQLEDLLRALQLSPHAIFQALIKPRNASEEFAKQALDWYLDLAETLTREGKTESGHTDHSMHIVAELNGLHITLLDHPLGAKYREVWSALAPSLPALRKTLGRDDIIDVELCFRALYAAILYRIKGEKGEITEDIVSTISPVIALLSDTYLKAERGEIALD